MQNFSLVRFLTWSIYKELNGWRKHELDSWCARACRVPCDPTWNSNLQQILSVKTHTLILFAHLHWFAQAKRRLPFCLKAHENLTLILEEYSLRSLEKATVCVSNNHFWMFPSIISFLSYLDRSCILFPPKCCPILNCPPMIIERDNLLNPTHPQNSSDQRLQRVLFLS